ncbi:tetratricopeptide repeat protein [Fluviicola chungangensis]|uniref:Tetratricopeptide repeat protein n=1 Tax=Fluviicola chungangensis TaxID=2597671 RepID=A0A556MNN6_9FLAO|nr:tetratricopeptide repeat protein [Fluviicola chungangensis]TSJ41319.1 tetratricopeptide repeat protein [Fluviicola chungangensis]
MRRLYILFLVQWVFIGNLLGQNSFQQQHEKFIRLHTDSEPEILLSIIRAEEQIIRKKGKNATRRDRAELTLDRGIYYYLIDEYEKCIPAFEQAAKFQTLQSAQDNIILYTYLGVSYRDGRQDYEKAHRHFDKAIELAEKKNDDELLASAVLKKASNYYNQDQIAQGIRLLESFMRKKEGEMTVNWKISFHGFLAQGYNKLGNYPRSYANFTAAIEQAEKTNNRELISDQYHNFILYYLTNQRYKEARDQSFKVIKLLKGKPGLEPKLYDSYAILGQIYSSLNQPDSALYYATKSHDYAFKTGDEESLTITYATLGHIYGDMKQYRKALDFLLKSASYEERLTGMSAASDIYHNIGVIYLKMKQYKQAITYFNKSNEQAYLEGDIYTLHLNYSDLAKADRGVGNLEQVVAMQDSSFLYYDSLNNIEKNRELFQLEVRYKTKLKEQENKLLKLEVKKQHEAQRDLIVLGIVVILLLLGILYILFIGNRLKKSKVAEAQVKIQNQELEGKLLVQRLHMLTEEINRKNNLIRSLENEANSQVEESLINKVSLENDWLAFMSEFDKIHSGYLSELKSRFPELTTNNLRLAALVKLEFSNKEIARILCITENGVKKAKQRLKERTKMD